MQTQIERKEANQRTTVPISTRVTKPMYEAILRFLKCSAHINTSDYLRDLIREDLERKGVFKEGADPAKVSNLATDLANKVDGVGTSGDKKITKIGWISSTGEVVIDHEA